MGNDEEIHRANTNLRNITAEIEKSSNETEKVLSIQGVMENEALSTGIN